MHRRLEGSANLVRQRGQTARCIASYNPKAQTVPVDYLIGDKGHAEEALHEASDGPVKRFRVLIGSGEHHAPFEGGNDLKCPRFRIGSADPL